MRTGVSQTNGLAHRDIEIFAADRGGEVFVELSTDKSIQFVNSFTEIVIFPHNTVQREVRNRSQNEVVTGNICKVL